MEKSKRALCISLLLWSVLCLLVHAQTLSTSLTSPCTLSDIDRDDDGLIEICDLEALDAIRYQLDGSGYRSNANAFKITAGCSVTEGCKGYELVGDLDFNDDASYRHIANKNIWMDGEGWQPIGNVSDSFAAIFKGNDHTISNLRIHGDVDNAGLFSRLRSDGEIDGLRLSNVNIQGNFWVGALVGWNEGTIYRSSIEEGTLIGEGGISGGLVGANFGIISHSDAYVDIIGTYKVGALAGDNNHWIINSCAGAKVVGTGSDVGGLVGYNDGSIINSCAHSDIEGSANNVGGLVGRNRGSLSNSYAASRVTAMANNIGGLVGVNDGLINDVYAMGDTRREYDVRGHYRVGGLVGHNKNSIVHSYATARVAGIGYTNGLIGLNHIEGAISESTATYSYWNLTVNREAVNGSGIFRTTAQLQSPTAPGDVPKQSYYGWSTRNWDFGTNRHYPALKYVEIQSEVVQSRACKSLHALSSTVDDDTTSAKCGDLLPGQYTRLSDLMLLDGLSLVPTFDPKIFNYRVVVDNDASYLRLVPIVLDGDAYISIVNDGEVGRRIESGTLSTIPLNASADATLITVARQYKINAVYSPRIKGIPEDHRVNEGTRIRLEVSGANDLRIRPRQYQWTQLSGVPLISDIDTRQSFLELDVPEDLVAETDDTTDIVLRVYIQDEIMSDALETTLTLVKMNNGSAPTRLVEPIFIEKEFKLLSFDLSGKNLSQDPDGIDGIDILGYRWQSKSPSATSNWHDIEGATDAHYNIPLIPTSANFTHYRVQVDYRDAQGYTDNSVVSEEFILPLVDIDRDDDGLIEIHYLEDFAAMQYQRDGSGYKDNINAPQKITAGCPAAKCIGYELLRDLDFNSDDSYRDLSNKSAWAGRGQWQYISSATGNNPFTAIFDGNHKTISNFKMRDTNEALASLFGHTRGKIMNLGLYNVDVSGPELVGGLVAHNEGIIANCYVTGNVALIDENFNGSSAVGGLVGVNGSSDGDSRVLIINSYASGTVKGNANYIGGLVGSNRAAMINSYARVNVEGSANYMGGLVGHNSAYGKIINGYVRGNVEGIHHLGGLVGYSLGEIIHSFAAVTMSGGDLIGGLVAVSVPEARVADSYWDSRIAESVYSVGGTSKTTVELQHATADESIVPTDTYYGWSNDDWDFGTFEQYPTLQYAPIPDSIGIALSEKDRTVCVAASANDETFPICGTSISDRRHGLDDLVLLAESDISIFPTFENSVSNYNLTIVGDSNRLRLIPTAVNQNDTIHINVDGKLSDENIKSGTTSSEIFLNSEVVAEITVEVIGKEIAYYRFNVHYIPFADVDEDDDGLIEIRRLEDLNAIRYNLYGSAYKASPNAAETTVGCPEQGCRGYELITHLDFDDDADYRRIENKALWTSGKGWQPIGNDTEPFMGVFRGNLRTISHLRINRPNVDDVALFGIVGEGAEIDGVGLLNTDIRGRLRVGGLVSSNLLGSISNSYVGGNIIAKGGVEAVVGGLVALNRGVVVNSYVIAYVATKDTSASVGGLVGWNLRESSGSHSRLREALILNSYAVGKVEGGRHAGGLVGRNSRAEISRSYAVVDVAASDSRSKGLVGNNEEGIISASYWDTTVTETREADIVDSIAMGAIALTTEALKTPTEGGSTSTLTYFNWSDKDWDFGTSEQYPILKYNHPECNHPTVPPCDTVFADQNDNRLRSLIFSEGVGLVPAFKPLTFIYDLYVGAEVEFIRLTPIAYRPAFITIYRDADIVEHLISGTTSISIFPDKESTIILKVVVQGGPLFQYTINVHSLDTIVHDIDEDNDGYIEIDNLEELDKIRYQSDGSGYRTDADSPKITIGCPASGCIGYELNRHLDFEDVASYRNADYRDATNREAWSSGTGWQPIRNFNGKFKANGNTISKLKINRPNTSNIALFADTGDRAILDGIGLLDVDIEGGGVVGGLVGIHRGLISNSYVIGNVAGHDIEVGNVGGLVGSNGGTINGSYSLARVSGNHRVGGLVGNNDGTIYNTYTVGSVFANTEGGGLVGRNRSAIINSYTISDVSMGHNGALVGFSDHGRIESSYWNIDTSIHRQSMDGKFATTLQLQYPIAPGLSEDETYFGWSSADWDFGAVDQYPVLKYRHSDCIVPLASVVCDTLLPNQRFGLLSLGLSEGTTLLPPFHSEVSDYDIVLDAGRVEFDITARSANPYSRIQMRRDENSDIDLMNGIRSRLIPADSQRIVIEVEDANGRLSVYTLDVHRLAFVVADIDQDNDGLIEINDLEGLNAIRYQLDGSGYRESDTAPVITEGCPPERGCSGYELTRDLDFRDDASYRDAANKKAWIEGKGWLPIGDERDAFNGIFKANGKTVSNPMIHRPDADNVGLFGEVGANGVIEGLALLNVGLVANNRVGALVGVNNGVINHSYTTGNVEGYGSDIGGVVGRQGTTGVIVNSYTRIKVSGNHYIGGLVGFNTGRIGGCYALVDASGKNHAVGGLVGGNSSGVIKNSYAIGDVVGLIQVGGLIGSNENNGEVINNYAVGSVSANSEIGGFIGAYSTDSTFSGNYWDTRASGIAAGGDGSRGYSGADLQTPIAPSETIYTGWSSEVWDFGTDVQYPRLKYITGADIANTFQNNPACGALEKPRCGVLLPGQRGGLVNLMSATKGFGLYPHFRRIVSDYQLTVFSDTQYIQLIPVAYAEEASIRIRDGNVFDEIIASATTSSKILLNTTATTVITLDVQLQNDTAVRYTVTVDRLDFTLTDNKVDIDGDGLIEINYLEDLHAVRYRLDGGAYRVDATAGEITVGCPVNGCRGYELSRDLNFAEDTSYRDAEMNKEILIQGAGWQPIGTADDPFIAVLNGNRKTISNLMINTPDIDAVGLFGVIGDGGAVSSIDLQQVAIVGRDNVGGLAGVVGGVVSDSSVFGSVEGDSKVGGLIGESLETSVFVNSRAVVRVAGTSNVGGAVGFNRGRISACYASGDVEAEASDVGGFVGNNFAGLITDSYAVGDVKGIDNVGGFVGKHSNFGGGVLRSYAIGTVLGEGFNVGGFGGMDNGGTFIANYWNNERGGIVSIVGSSGFGSAAMQFPTMPTDTIYVGWNTDLWDFGTSSQYPSLKYINGADISDLFEDNPICASSTALPECGTVLSSQHIALIDLMLLPEGFSLSPHFRSSVYNYQATVFSDTNTIQLAAVAYNDNSMIHIHSDSGANEVMIGATTSSAIPLYTNRPTVVTITVQRSNENKVLYTIELNRLAFTTNTNRIDGDGDGLIDIYYLEDLDAVRYQLDGSGYRASSTASKITVGCPATGCNGYELLRDLDFEDDRSYRDVVAHKEAWISNEGWLPIGTEAYPFAAVFNGNNKTIANLKINRPNEDGVGLYGEIGVHAKINGVGLYAMNIIGNDKTGGLVGISRGVVVNSYTDGYVEGRHRVGGLVGESNAAIVNSYADGDVSGMGYIGGLVGLNRGNITGCYVRGDVAGEGYDIGGFIGGNFGGVVRNNYARGSVEGGNNVGGFIGGNRDRGEVVHNYAIAEVVGDGMNIGAFSGVNTGILFIGNYWDRQVSGINTDIAGNLGVDTADLQSLASRDIYADWDVTAWHFETGVYPSLKHVKGIVVTNLPADRVACDVSSAFVCGSLLFGQHIGLTNLEITSPGLTLFPDFDSGISAYRMTVYADLQSIRLIPTVRFIRDQSPSIRITQGADFDEMVFSAVASPAIPLHTTGTTTIEIEVYTENDRTVRYSIAVSRLEFLKVGEKIDDDGDGLIEIDYWEDLNAIRYQPDGSGYRASASASKIVAGCPIDGCFGYEMNRDLDFKDSTSYRDEISYIKSQGESAGWLPIGSVREAFAGVFLGHGRTISNLMIRRPKSDNIALFARISKGSRIENVVLSTVDIEGRFRVAGLVANNTGTIGRSRVSGEIVGDREVGGIVGRNATDAKIIASSAIVELKANAHGGGLVGGNYGVVHSAYAGGRIASDARDSSEHIGGLVGYNESQIINSFAMNDVAGHRIIGGLVGANSGDEIAKGTILNSYAVNTVQANTLVGGLVGRNEHTAEIINSYADSKVSGKGYGIGGLVGFNSSVIGNTYSSGSVSGSRVVGGLVGENSGSIDYSYTVATVAGNVSVGGLVGDGNGIVVHSHWDIEAVGLEYSVGGSGFGTSALQTPIEPSNTVSSPYYSWRSEDWHFGNADQYPKLRYTVGVMNIDAACGDDAQLPMCETLLLPYGLSNLEILEPSGIFPPFAFSHLDYRVTVNQNERYIRVVPTSYASDAVIVVKANGRPQVTIDSGGVSPLLELNQGGTTELRIEIESIVYKLVVEHSLALDARIDIDDDDDGLIEIAYLEDLYAIRYQPDGTAYREGSATRRITAGCTADGCRGYELVADLDFNRDASYRNPRINKPKWTTQRGWIPIGGLNEKPFNSLLKANGHSIYNLVIDRPEWNTLGLFGVIANDAEIDGVGLLNVHIRGFSEVGGLVGRNDGGKITNSYLSGRISAEEHVGGLVGRNNGAIFNSYAAGQVSNRGNYVGGLVGLNHGNIVNGYATSHVTGGYHGGTLVGLNSGIITHSYAVGGLGLDDHSLTHGLIGLNVDGEITGSYWDIETSEIATGMYGRGAGSEMLKSPVVAGTTETNIYYSWQHSDWDFGTPEHYPALKYTYDENVLLPHQRGGLRSLTVSDKVKLFPAFNTHVFDYHIVVPIEVRHITLQAIAIDDNATIEIDSEYLTNERLTPMFVTVPVTSTSASRIELTVKSLHGESISYGFTMHHSPLIEIVGIPSHHTVGEGQRVRLRATHPLDSGSFSYRWTQVSGPALLSEAKTDAAVLDFSVAADALPKALSYAEAVLSLYINVGDSILNEDVLLIIEKRNNGVIDRIKAPIFQNSELVAPVDFFADADGMEDPVAIAYQWQSTSLLKDVSWHTIDGATERLYRIPARITDATRYRVLISYADKQGYIHKNIASQEFIALDLDVDDDGLIEISGLGGLNAMRHILSGIGYKHHYTATTSTIGCPVHGCKGYELVEDLDLNGLYLQPIGSDLEPFTGIFKGNNHTISNFRIEAADGVAGLFGVVSSSAEIDGVGLVDVDVKGGDDVGCLAGINEGIITNSYAVQSTVVGLQGGVGGLVGRNRGIGNFSAIVANSYANVYTEANSDANSISAVGGLVGMNVDGGMIINSYAENDVTGPCNIGGLVGHNEGDVTKISNSYAVGNATRFDGVGTCGAHGLALVNGLAGFVGGLVGRNDEAIIEYSYATGRVLGVSRDGLGGLIGGDLGASVTNSYWDITTSEIGVSAGGIPKTTVELQSSVPSGSTATDIYTGWSRNDWDFGTLMQYPALKYGGVNRYCGPPKSSSCGLLLPSQSRTSGIKQLILSKGGVLVPDFNSDTFAYRIMTDRSDTIEFTLILENLNAAGKIIRNGIFLRKATSGERVSIAIEETTTTLIIVELKEADERSIRYELRIHRMPEVIISGPLNGEVDEGMRVGINGTVERSFDATDPLRYHWEQLSGPPLPLDMEAKAQADLDFTVPENSVDKLSTSSVVLLRLTVDDGAASVSEYLSMRINKINNGGISAAAPRFISAFTVWAPEVDLSGEVDGIGVEEDISYQWQEDFTSIWRDISGATDKVYHLELNTAPGTLYRVQLSYIDGQAYTNTTASKAIMFDLDLDRDDDGLIEIGSLEELDAMRHTLKGDGYRADSNSTVVATGCPMSVCKGYELAAHLDFRNDADYRHPAVNKSTWFENGTWQPIGAISDLFDAIFDGNGYTISNLTIQNDGYDVGLFGVIGENAKILHVGLLNADIEGTKNVGAIVGTSVRGTISDSYAIATVTAQESAGGLVGVQIGGTINNSYADGSVGGGKAGGGLVGNDLTGILYDSYTSNDVRGNNYAGGLIGFASNNTINNSYVRGRVISDNESGGLIGFGIKLRPPMMSNSYWNKDKNTTLNDGYGIALTTAQLQTPTSPGTTSTEVYYGWSVDDWDFGDESQYPILKGASGVVLSNQHVGLLSLSLSDAAKLSPSFSPEIFYYRVTVDAAVNQIGLLPVAADTTDIRINGFEVKSGELSSPIILRPTTATVITIDASAKDALPVRYTLDVNNNFPRVVIASMPQGELNEGDQVVLDVKSEDPNGDELRYRWSQNSGVYIWSDVQKLVGVIENQDDADLVFKVPENLLTATQDHGVMELKLSVDDGTASVDKIIPLYIKKKNNGSIPKLPSPALRNRSYIAPEVHSLLLQDPDGAAHLNTVRYQWQKYERMRWIDIDDEISAHYTPSAAEIDQSYRVFLSYTDNQGHRDNVASGETVYTSSEMSPTNLFILIRVLLEGLLSK